MGGALVKGLLSAGRVKAAGISVTDIDADKLRSFKRMGVRTGTDVRRAVRGAGVILLCVKPRQMEGLLRDVRGALTGRPLVLSIAAGLKTSFFEKRLGRVPVIRVMPNTPALVRAGVMAYCRGRHATAHHEKMARTLLSAVGETWRFKERQMDAVTALSGSGPAYLFYLAESLLAAGAALGLGRDQAEGLTRETLYGSALLLKGSSDGPEELRRRVTSPGGTTEAALKVLQKAGFKKAFQRALSAARRRSRELSK